MPKLEKIEKYNFKKCLNITKLSLLKLKIVALNVFGDCTMLSKLNLPLLEEIGEAGFNRCKNLTELDLPSLKVCSGFCGCSKLSSLSDPNLVEIEFEGFKKTCLSELNLPSLVKCAGF